MSTCKTDIIDEFRENYPTCQAKFLFLHSDNVIEVILLVL